MLIGREIDEALEAARRLHPDGSFSIGKTHGSSRWNATVHYKGLCFNEWGATASEAYAKALQRRDEECPDERTAAARRVEAARQELRRARALARELGA